MIPKHIVNYSGHALCTIKAYNYTVLISHADKLHERHSRTWWNHLAKNHEDCSPYPLSARWYSMSNSTRNSPSMYLKNTVRRLTLPTYGPTRKGNKNAGEYHFIKIEVPCVHHIPKSTVAWVRMTCTRWTSSQSETNLKDLMFGEAQRFVLDPL